MTGRVVERCPRCGSPFLKACAAPGWAVCRSCCGVVTLQHGAVLAEPPTTAVVTTVTDRAGLPAGARVAQRWTVRGLLCEQLIEERAS